MLLCKVIQTPVSASASVLLPLLQRRVDRRVESAVKELLHRIIARTLSDRGVKIERTYQLNTGGNTDFLNMLEQTRLASKKVSKTEAVQSQLDQRLDSENIHIGPSDYVPWQNDNKVCFLRMEWLGFGDVPMNLEARLSVEDSPNSAGVVIDAIRCAKLALDRGIGGPLDAASACMMKHPRRQMRDSEAFIALERFIDEDIVSVEGSVGAEAGKGGEPAGSQGHHGPGDYGRLGC